MVLLERAVAAVGFQPFATSAQHDLARRSHIDDPMSFAHKDEHVANPSLPFVISLRFSDTEGPFRPKMLAYAAAP
jgi:hypothetical protein